MPKDDTHDNEREEAEMAIYFRSSSPVSEPSSTAIMDHDTNSHQLQCAVNELWAGDWQYYVYYC